MESSVPTPTFMPEAEAHGSRSPAERICEFVAERARIASGRLFHQGARKPPLACTCSAPLVRFFAEERVHRVSTAVARALVACGDGFPVEVTTAVPAPRHVLALQARGARCVSLLSDDASTSPHADALAFTLHDLCHLDKYVDPEHHIGQVGFFACLHEATSLARWHSFETSLDEAFRQDWHHVAADMNGSAVFLFAALKMKLKMAVRRRAARERRVDPPDHGPLTTEESRAYEEALGELLGLLRLGPAIADAARATSAKRDDPRSALRLLAHFENLGVSAIRESSSRPQRLH
jgi:hypothetical protein